MLVHGHEVVLEKLNDKMARRILNHTPSLMIVEVTFQKGGVGEPHRHSDHEQMGYILRGSFKVRVDDETSVLVSGDSFYAGKNVLHGVEALEDSALLDIFTPRRDDFLI
jgi:quercetin dioxygenase-like cupin family protein